MLARKISRVRTFSVKIEIIGGCIECLAKR